MTAGLIVLEPWATDIIERRKTKEYRKKAPPMQYYKTDIYLLSGGVVLGKIRIYDYRRIRDDSYIWSIKVIEEFQDQKKYIHPKGAQVWVKDVVFGKITMDVFL